MRTRLLPTFILMAITTMLATSVADALPWGPVTSTYKKVVRVEGSGDHFNDRRVNAANRMTIRDRSNDGNSVYRSTEFSFWAPNNVGVWGFNHTTRRGTGERSNTTFTVTVSVGLSGDGTQSRAVSKVCAQMGWPIPDSCGQAVSTWNY